MHLDKHLTEIDRNQVFHAVQSMIARYGYRAPIEAARRSAELAIIGESECADLWREIAKHAKIEPILRH